MVHPATALIVFFSLVAVIYLLYLARQSNFFKSAKQKDKINLEDILKQMYHVELSGRKTSVNDLAGALRLKDHVTLKLIEKATEKKLLTSSDGLIQLTPEGTRYALQIIRKHRLWEKYLSEKTGVTKLEWHDRAEKMEHKLSAVDLEDLDKKLGSPRFDPHGDPIPTAFGDIEHVQMVPLSTLTKGMSGEIIHIEDEPRVIYKQIVEKRLHVGSMFTVLEADDHAVVINSEGMDIHFTPIVASNIHVEEVELNAAEESALRLSDLQEGDKGQVIALSGECRGANRRRLLDLGFIKGTEIIPEFNSPLKDPRAYRVRNTLIALRNNQAEHILVEKL